MQKERKPDGYWNIYERCYEEARKYTSRVEFKKNNGSAYNKALKNGWIKDYTWFESKQRPGKYWNNYDNCYEAAKQCTSRTEFEKKYSAAYKLALRNNWLDDYTWFESKQRPSGYWNDETCYELARQCKSRTEFSRKSSRAYDYAKNHGLLDTYTWFESKQKPGKYWNSYERCYEAAKECKTRYEFGKKYRAAYKSALRNSWLDDYTWFEVRQKPTGYWDKEHCYEEAKKCHSCAEFKKNNDSAYSKALKNGWIKDYTWFEQQHQPNGYWNHEHCYEAAKQCTSRTDFFKKYPTAYKNSLKNNWLDEFTWLIKKDNPVTGKLEYIYAVKFVELHAVYVGLSVHPDTRFKQHKKDEKSGIYKFAKANNVPIPDMEILETSLSLEDAQIMEDYYRQKYIEDGWNVLNIAATGLGRSALGKLGVHWSYTKTYEEAKKYNSRSEFQKKSKGAYSAAKRNGWLDDYTWFERKQKPSGYWNKEHCYEAAKECYSCVEFATKYGTAYQKALKHGWLKDYTWFERKHKPNGYWNNYQHCYNAAKDCKSVSGFRKQYNRACYIACKNNWLQDYTWLYNK